ncbi:MAG: Hsp20/alpha crystallin family protein [Flavobacteriales bacterium]
MKLLSSKRNLPAFNSYFDDFFTKDLMEFPLRKIASTAPSVNIKEDDSKFIIEVAAPGMNKTDFSVNIDGDTMTISSVKENKQEEKNERYTRKEFHYSSFQRSFTLPEELINLEKITANYDNGILKVELPKLNEARVNKVKEIKVG